MNTLNYWENRYKNNGNSGAGSYGRLAEFKAEIINKFIADKNINSVIILPPNFSRPNLWGGFLLLTKI